MLEATNARKNLARLIGRCVLTITVLSLGVVQARGASAPIAGMQEHQLGPDVRLDQMTRLGTGSSVAGEILPGHRVFSNESDAPSVYLPGANQRMADDLTLASGACNLVYYELAVVGGLLGSAAPTFDVTVAMWDGDPCEPGSSIISGTEASFTGIPADQEPRIISVQTDVPIGVPSTVWLAATFSINDAGWLTAQCPEVGETENVWSENDSSIGCGLYVFTSGAWAGYWANVHCDLPAPPLGACCDLTECTQTTEADCTEGVWQGAYTTCEPNTCLAGTCCTGESFDTCTETTEAGCSGRCGGQGVFSPGATCAEGCAANFKVYENDFRTGLFSGIDPTTKYGDDLTFAAGTPCELLAYDVIVFGDPEPSAQAFFDATVELWTNDDGGTPNVPEDDKPFEPIPGTRREFHNIPADLFGHRLLASGFTDIILPEKAWLVIETNSEDAGPGLGGNADIGETLDLFAIFNDPSGPGQWLNVFNFGGFDPTGCPGGAQCVPAGSFRADVWCAGSAPTGACCDQFAGTCTEGVEDGNCIGRWVEGGTCDPETFFPPCGTHACCNRAIFNPDVIICQNLTTEECDQTNDGFTTLGKFCDEVECPTGTCFGFEGDCLSEHATPGCQNPYCTCAVCDADPFCCGEAFGWDAFCVQQALTLCSEFENNALCATSKTITGTGFFGFDNTNAGTDGPTHPTCGSADGDIIKDVWFNWTATCNNRVHVSTCEQTFVDTKIAVYEGTTCPPTTADLVACNDDRCGLQTLALFDAVQGQQYLIRIGSAPGQGAGPGQFRLTCGPPTNPACPGAGGCCGGTGTPGCSDATCCRTVCACDPFCCDTEWDSACGTIGFEETGCGAAVLCLDSCAQGCPPGPVAGFEPSSGVVDARRPFDEETGTILQGIDHVSIIAPDGAEADCFAFCETDTEGSDNDIASVSDMAGLHAVEFLRPITPGAATTVTYENVLGGTTTLVYISHPGNVNGNGAADSDDALALVAFLSEIGTVPWGLFSADIDGSGTVTSLDLWELMNLLNGARSGMAWDGTVRPSPIGICP